MKRGAEDFSADIELRPTKHARLNEIQHLLNTADECEIMRKLEQMITENLLSLEDLIYQIPEGPKKGQSALWWLAQEVDEKLFMAVWNQFKDEIPLEALLVQAQDKYHKGTSALWWLARRLDIDKHEAFIAVWDKFKHEIQLEALLELNPYGSVLWSIAKAGAWSKPEVFMAVWNQFKESIPLEALLKRAEEGLYTGWSVLFCIASMPQSEDKESFGPAIAILKNIAQNTEIILSDLPQVKALIDLNIMASQAFVTEEEVKALFALAEIGQAIGYVNAFHDVGEYFESIGNLPKAFEAYELVSSQSPHYQKVCLDCGENKVAEAAAETDESLRIKHLKEALEWAIKIQDKAGRLYLIRMIAKFYILGSTEQLIDSIISDEQLMLIQDKSEVDFYFYHFDQIKKRIEAEKIIKDLETQFQEEEKRTELLQKNNAELLLTFEKLSEPRSPRIDKRYR